MIHSLPSSEPLTAQKLFSKLYVSYYARLVRFASLYVGAMGDAENIVQDFFLYLWERKEILPELQQPDAYLFSAGNCSGSRYGNHHCKGGKQICLLRCNG